MIDEQPTAVEPQPLKALAGYNIRFVDQMGVLSAKEGKFAGIEWSFGAVSFPEDAPENVMSFDYNVYSEIPEDFDKEEFETFLGDLLVAMLREQMDRGDLLFKNTEPAEEVKEDEA